ncbi:hypothetical protein PtB15_1B1003 [Puccinia triticina]|nr:hypothetical protein PtB15_1B1003 [Puccinia triticina]
MDRPTEDVSPSTRKSMCPPSTSVTDWGEPCSGEMAPISQPRVLSSGPVGIPLASPTTSAREEEQLLDPQASQQIDSLPASPLISNGPLLLVSDLYPADLVPEPDELESSHSALVSAMPS